MIPVPYVAAWSSEFAAAHVALPDPALNGRLSLFPATGAQGEGEPVLGRLSYPRQRRAVIRKLCQVCARPVRTNGIYAPLWETPPDMTEPVLCEPASCLKCMALMLEHRWKDVDEVFTLRSHRVALTMTLAETKDGEKVAAVGYAKVVPVRVKRTMPRSWVLKKAATLRRR